VDEAVDAARALVVAVVPDCWEVLQEGHADQESGEGEYMFVHKLHSTFHRAESLVVLKLMNCWKWAADIAARPREKAKAQQQVIQCSLCRPFVWTGLSAGLFPSKPYVCDGFKNCVWLSIRQPTERSTSVSCSQS